MWLTPRNPIGDLVTYCLEFPPSGDWSQIVKGALYEIMRHENYEEWIGGIEVDDTIPEMQAIYASIRRCFVLKAGDIFASYRTILDGTALPCDGSDYLKDDYPELAEELAGVTWSDSTHFNVPDLQGRAPFGSGSGSGLSTRLLDQSGGEERHTLATSELPSHAHDTHAHLSSIAQLGVGEPVSTPALTGQSSGNTGDGNPHNNMPPYRIVHYYIVTGK